MSTGCAPQGKEAPCQLFFFLFDVTVKLVGFALYLTKESHMRIRVGLVLLTVTYVKEEVCTPTWAINTKNMALSHAINQ